MDFEWLAGLLYLALYRAAGAWGLVGLRLTLMALTMLAVIRRVASYGFGPAAQGLAALILGSVVLPYGDLRPDNFSVFFFALLAYGLESAKAGPGKARLAAVFALFALWSNLHLGWAFGLALIGLRAAGHALDRRWREARWTLALLAAACAGTLVNPYGWGLWWVLLDHARRIQGMSLEIQEWARPDFRDPFRWPLAALLLASAAGLLARLAARRRPPMPAVLGLLFFGAAALRHDRHLTFFGVFAVPALFALAQGARANKALKAAGAVAFAALAVAMGRFAWSAPRIEEPSRELADFLDAQAERLSGLPLYNTWEDGGYLGWRLFPRFLVYFDGRYLFHAQLDEVREAALSARSWKAFLDRRGVALACMKRSPLKSFVEGGARRPYYAAYMPASDWALVHWDARRLVFARRSSVDRRWLRAHEFSFLRPDDADFLSARAAPRRPPVPAIDAELERLRRQAPSAVPEAAALARALTEPAR